MVRLAGAGAYCVATLTACFTSSWERDSKKVFTVSLFATGVTAVFIVKYVLISALLSTPPPSAESCDSLRIPAEQSLNQRGARHPHPLPQPVVKVTGLGGLSPPAPI